MRLICYMKLICVINDDCVKLCFKYVYYCKVRNNEKRI